MSQSKEQLRRIRKQKDLLRNRCREYVEGFEALLDTRDTNGTFLNLYELSALQALLFALFQNVSPQIHLKEKVERLGYVIPKPWTDQELYKMVLDQEL